jgi:hypothetical protein
MGKARPFPEKICAPKEGIMDKTFTPGTSRLMDQVRETQRYFHDSYST